MPAATLSIVSPRTNVKNSSKPLIFLIFFPFRVAAKQVGVGPAEKDRGFPPVGGEPLPVLGDATMLRHAALCWATETRKVGGWSLFRFGQFFGRNGTDRKGREKATAFLGRKIRRPLRARNRMESNGKGMSAKGTALAGLGLRHPPHSSGCKSRDQMRMPQGRAEWGLRAYETSR